MAIEVERERDGERVGGTRFTAQAHDCRTAIREGGRERERQRERVMMEGDKACGSCQRRCAGFWLCSEIGAYVCVCACAQVLQASCA